MKNSFKKYHSLILTILVLQVTLAFSQTITDYKHKDEVGLDKSIITNQFQYNGYTNYWHDIYRTYSRYGNLIKVATPNIDYTIAQSKVDIADDLQIPGLAMQEGFIFNLLKSSYSILDQPSQSNLEEAIKLNNVLALVDPDTELGKKIAQKIPANNPWREKLKSHQYGAKDFVEVNAVYLESGAKKLFVVLSKSKAFRDQLAAKIEDTKSILSQYDMHRGWFGAESLLKSVTCTAGHPLEIIGKGMNEGNTWFTLSGYMDFLTQKELVDWLAKVKLPVVADVGFGNQVYGCKDYDGLQIQQMFAKDAGIKFAKEKQGYAFRAPYDVEADPFKYDGYIAGEGNKEQIDTENVPFVTTTGTLDSDAIPSMVLFLKKGESISKESMWKAIMDRREVSVLNNGKMMGPALYRNALELLLLDRVSLEEYFGSRVNLEATTKDYKLSVTVSNTYNHAVTGTVEVVLPAELKIQRTLTSKITIAANSSKVLQFTIIPQQSAMGKTNPIALHFKSGTLKKSTLTMLDLPRAISVQQLLYAHASKVTYPVTIHNFSNKPFFPVKVEVVDKLNPKKIVFSTTATCNTATGTFKDLSFDLPVPAGSYQVITSALGLTNTSQLGVGKAVGAPYLYTMDLNSDGIMEYRMENDSVQITLLSTGARVIEYIVKSRNDNILFKLWPDKSIDDRRAYRKRGYYPYGGFEDFLGQGSMETHKIYDVKVIKKEGDYVQVKMTADYYGNKLEKIFTLYGNSPLLEIQFALTFKNPEANVLGPQPILELGATHGPEDVFMVPEKDGVHEYRMMMERYYGKLFFLKEGWNAGYDTKEDISFVGAYPVSEPLFLHMWMNHPSNPDAHHYYSEFQPWVPIYQKSTMYFSYYMWGAGGKYETGLQALRDRNLITTR